MVWRSGTVEGRPGHNGSRVGESILETGKSQNQSRGSDSLAKPTRFADLGQIDGEVWTIPSESMKSLKGNVIDFRVPLSVEAQLVEQKNSCR